MKTTLDLIRDLEARQEELAKMIETLKASTPATYHTPEVSINLNPGEHCAGIVLDSDGKPDYNLILLPGDEENLNWVDAKKWAAEHGGELPSRKEQALLFANLRSHLKPTWYWSSQQYETESSWAWYQDFDCGGQGSSRKYCKIRARAIRREYIPKV